MDDVYDWLVAAAAGVLFGVTPFLNYGELLQKYDIVAAVGASESGVCGSWRREVFGGLSRGVQRNYYPNLKLQKSLIR